MSKYLAYELRELAENLTRVYETVNEAVRGALAGLELTPVAEPGPVGFEYTDHGDDTLHVVPGSRGDCLLSVNSCADHVGVDLDQDAVNRLAQYLDRHRTDGPKVPVNVRNPCEHCGHAPHGSVGCGEASAWQGRRCPCRGGA